MKPSPSFFFHDAIPPSVMVGDIAGILNLVMARDADVALSPSIRASGLIVCREVEGRVIHLRGWQRADLNNGEGDMRAGRKGLSDCWGSDGTRWGRAEELPRTATAFRSSRAFPCRYVPFWCCALHFSTPRSPFLSVCSSLLPSRQLTHISAPQP